MHESPPWAPCSHQQPSGCLHLPHCGSHSSALSPSLSLPTTPRRGLCNDFQAAEQRAVPVFSGGCLVAWWVLRVWQVLRVKTGCCGQVQALPRVSLAGCCLHLCRAPMPPTCQDMPAFHSPERPHAFMAGQRTVASHSPSPTACCWQGRQGRGGSQLGCHCRQRCGSQAGVRGSCAPVRSTHRQLKTGTAGAEADCCRAQQPVQWVVLHPCDSTPTPPPPEPTHPAAANHLPPQTPRAPLNRNGWSCKREPGCPAEDPFDTCPSVGCKRLSRFGGCSLPTMYTLDYLARASCCCVLVRARWGGVGWPPMGCA